MTEACPFPFTKGKQPFTSMNVTYYTTNECIATHRLMLEGKSFDNPASICSGGEVPLFVLAPRSKQVLCVDHYIGQLAVAAFKAAVLLVDGPTKAKSFFTGPGLTGKAPDDAVATFDRVKHLLPAELVAWFNGQHYAEFPWTRVWQWYTIQQCWTRYTDDMVAEAASHAHKLRFYHGDMTEIGKDHDFFYLSNALEYSHAQGMPPDQIAACLKPGSLALCTGLNMFTEQCTRYVNGVNITRLWSGRSKWETLNQIQAVGSLQWKHTLARLTEYHEEPAGTAVAQ